MIPIEKDISLTRLDCLLCYWSNNGIVEFIPVPTHIIQCIGNVVAICTAKQQPQTNDTILLLEHRIIFFPKPRAEACIGTTCPRSASGIKLELNPQPHV